MTVEAIETEQIRRIVAVGAIIMASDGRILVVQETVSKPVIDKQPGDWTFPAETLEAGETIIEGVRRMIPKKWDHFHILFIRPKIGLEIMA